MQIISFRDVSTLNFALTGRLDTSTAPQLDEVLKTSLGDSILEINFDFAKLDYISSAGLRVLLSAQKTMNKRKGKMVIRNVNETIREVFDITGFSDILTIEDAPSA